MKKLKTNYRMIKKDGRVTRVFYYPATQCFCDLCQEVTSKKQAGRMAPVNSDGKPRQIVTVGPECRMEVAYRNETVGPIDPVDPKKDVISDIMIKREMTAMAKFLGAEDPILKQDYCVERDIVMELLDEIVSREKAERETA
ncbi:hypothetical protein KJ969_01055 [Patescibacteria group bacterium]|nr:hypothetical protein [Patescibacteria group bacterium]MBU1922447.1 hypothetical protein [Patescibacteria group bacterium]